MRSVGWERLLAPLSVLGRYVSLLFAPIKLSPDYGAAVTWYTVRWNEPYVYIGAAAVLVYVIWFVMAVCRRWAAVLSCLACMAIAYILISNWLVIIGTIMGERLIYLTSAYFIIMVSLGLSRLRREAMAALMLIILPLMAWRTVSYAWQWNNAMRLFSMARANFPQSVMLHVLEAEEHIFKGDWQGASDILQKGREVVPEAPNVWKLSAIVAEHLGHDAQAELFYRKAQDLDETPPHMPRGSGRTRMTPAIPGMPPKPKAH